MGIRPIQSTLESDVCRFIFSGFTTSTDLLLGFIPKEFQVRFQAFRCLIYKVQFSLLPFGKLAYIGYHILNIMSRFFSIHRIIDKFCIKSWLYSGFYGLSFRTAYIEYHIYGISSIFFYHFFENIFSLFHAVIETCDDCKIAFWSALNIT